jgi:general L-amino acid transport system permease protein
MSRESDPARPGPAGDPTAADVAGNARPPWQRDVRILRNIAQGVFLILIIALVQWFTYNLTTNMRRLGIRRDFAFLDQPAGYRILGSDFVASDKIRQALLVGLANTVRVAVIGMLLALLIGIIVGVGRLSTNWVVRRSASLYVELLRNVPPLVLVIYFYLAALAALPRIEDAVRIGDGIILSNRGIWLPWFDAAPGSGAFGGALALCLVLALLVARWRTSVFETTGRPHHRALFATLVLVVGAAAAWSVLQPPITLSLPVFGDRIVEGGLWLYPEYLSLLISLVLYASSFIAEIVRGSIQAVPRGQSEAADSLGLTPWTRLRYVVLPQALRIAAPATGNEFLNLTKNVSLGIAVGFAEILRVATQATGNGQPAPQLLLMVLIGYLGLSLIISFFVNIANRRLQLVER